MASHDPHGETLSPDTHLRAPRRPLPEGTVDCHAHVFDRFERYPLAPGRKYSPPLCTREAWLALHDALGVRYGVQVHGSPYGFDNSITEDFIQAHRDRLIGIAVVPAEVTANQIKRLDLAGFRGVRLMDQFPTGATTAMLEPIARAIAPFGWHVEINIADPAHWVDLAPRLVACGVPVVMDHLGRPRGGAGIDQPGFKAVRKLLTEHDRFWVKLSSWYRLSASGPPDLADMRPFAQALVADRPDRCVWATNWPHPSLTKFMPNDADLVDQLDGWLPADDAVREAVFAKNAQRLYRIR